MTRCCFTQKKGYWCRRRNLGRVIGWHEFPAALGLRRREVVAFVGGGGKTTALFALGRYRSGRCVITTTTKMGVDRTGGVPVLVGPGDDEVAAALDEHEVVIVWSATNDQRAIGVDPARCDRWVDLADTVAVEADGSRRMPFKAPREYEPVLPRGATMVVACVGMAALGVPLEVGCHRPDRVAAVAGCAPSDVLTPQRLVRVLLGGDGSRKDVPAGARYAVMLNRATPADEAAIAEIVERLAEAEVPVVTVADVAAAALPDRV